MSDLPSDLEAEKRAGMSGLERAIARFFLFSAGVALILMSLLTVADVVGRSFNSPLPAATELTEFLMVIVIFCALPVVTRRGDHIVIDILDFIVPPALRRIEDVIINLLGAVALAALITFGSNCSRGTPGLWGTCHADSLRSTGLTSMPLSCIEIWVFIDGHSIWMKCGSSYWPLKSGR